jgi:hypothetical protein
VEGYLDQEYPIQFAYVFLISFLLFAHVANRIEKLQRDFLLGELGEEDGYIW